MNLCRACKQDFASVALFDAHRVGKHAFTFREGLQMKPPREDGRRCLDVEEMKAKGWELDQRARWHDPAHTRQVREAFSALYSRAEKPREATGVIQPRDRRVA